MAIRTVVTRGYGNGTFNGTIPLVTTRGYAIGEAPPDYVRNVDLTAVYDTDDPLTATHATGVTLTAVYDTDDTL